MIFFNIISVLSSTVTNISVSRDWIIVIADEISKKENDEVEPNKKNKNSTKLASNFNIISNFIIW